MSLGARVNTSAAKGKATDVAVGSSQNGLNFTTKQMIGDRTALHFAAEKGAVDIIAVS